MSHVSFSVAYFSSSSGHFGSCQRIFDARDDAASAMSTSTSVNAAMMILLNIAIPPKSTQIKTNTINVSCGLIRFNAVRIKKPIPAQMIYSDVCASKSQRN